MSRIFSRWWWALLLIAVILGLWRLRFDVDILNLLPPDEPTVQGLKLYQRHFTNARELLISLRAADAERAQNLARDLAGRLASHSNLVARVNWQPPWLEQPEKLAELLAFAWLNQPPAEFAALTNHLSPRNLPAVLAATKETLATTMSPMDLTRLAFDPFNLVNLPGLAKLGAFSSAQEGQMFASAEGEFRLIYVYAAEDLGGYRECERWLAGIQGIVNEAKASDLATWSDVRIRYTGRPVFVQEIARSMQNDMRGSVVGTSIIIALLFWLMHRRWLPMLWLLALLAVVLISTVALGGLILGSISIVSMGFAAVLLGLAVDYAVVHYQEALAHPQLSIPEIRRAIAPSILWAAITTISAFLVLNLGGLPGLAQLGTLVALGVALAALVMVMIYLPPLFPARRKAPAGNISPAWWQYFVPPRPSEASGLPARPAGRQSSLWVTGLVVVLGCAVLLFKMPGVDETGDALRPTNSEAERALAEITIKMGLPPEPLWLIVSGGNEPEVYERMASSEALLKDAVSSGVISGYLLPSMLWPRAKHQADNRPVAKFLATQEPVLLSAVLAAGFNTNAMILTHELLQTWARAGKTEGVLWPTNDVSEFVLKRFVAQEPKGWIVIGLVTPPTNSVHKAAIATLSLNLAQKGGLLSGWNLLGSTTLKRVRERQWLMLTPMVLLVLASLLFAFRRTTEILLGAGVLLLSGLVLLAVMALAGWSWNLLNMMSLPLIMGTGVDYSIFMQMGLRRSGGDAALVRKSIGRALLLCGGTAVAGFGSLAWSSNPGMASLGKVCAVGIGCNMLIAINLLPGWWIAMVSQKAVPNPNEC